MSAELFAQLQARSGLIHAHVQACTGNTVSAGPFRGMKLLPDASWGGGDMTAKLLGHYESELHPLIEKLAAMRFDEIFNIGCAEGFYAIGFAMRSPDSRVFAFDCDANAQRVCSANCAANAVETRVAVAGICEPPLLNSLMHAPAQRLLFADCEGCELVLIDLDLVPGLRRATLLIECHDFMDRRITPTLIRRLKPTHDLQIIGEGGRDPNQSPQLRSFNSFDRWLALCEFRPETMHWLLASPKLS